MNKTQKKIKDKLIEVTNLGLTDKAKYHAYEEVYPYLLDKFVGKTANLLEVGTGHGGGLKVLCELFPECNVYGVDHNPSILKIDVEEYPNLTFIQSDQCDASLADKLPMLDFVTEDGSHQMSESLRTFEILEPKLNPGAIYAIEDIYPQFFDAYVNDGRFEIFDVRDKKGREDDVVAVYYKK